ncbi:hypothetical protein [Streptomyces sp. NPDC008001]|uniref:hypothetical protein n=1 Tax=Streptomyces sp. NPDC008001 TaxID=3364804 RepID=UPI0036E1E643
MADQAQQDTTTPSSKSASDRHPGKAAHQVRLVLLVLLAAGAVLALLMPIEFEKSYGIFEKETKRLKCGSVIFPREEVGSTTYNLDCAVARSRHLGYAGLCLAGAVVVTAFGLAKQAGARANGTTARQG